MEETTIITVTMNDRLGRRLILQCNNDQKCVVAGWIEEDRDLTYDGIQIDNREFYRRLFGRS